ncbi:hypothetical protein Ndes2437B_g05849 [Nannochloris sp. 'desiccata']
MENVLWFTLVLFRNSTSEGAVEGGFDDGAAGSSSDTATGASAAETSPYSSAVPSFSPSANAPLALAPDSSGNKAVSFCRHLSCRLFAVWRLVPLSELLLTGILSPTRIYKPYYKV